MTRLLQLSASRLTAVHARPTAEAAECCSTGYIQCWEAGTRLTVPSYLEQLYWLPVRARVQFKLCTLMHAIHNKRCPAYLADVVQLVGMASTRTGLRSADSSNYSLPRLNTRVGERAFSYAGPAAWNQLPESIRQLQTTSFKHKLKTFLFTQCYNSAD